MEASQKRKVLNSIGVIYEVSEKSKFSDELFEKIDKDLQLLSSYFSVTKMQAFFLAHAFTFNIQEMDWNITSLASHCECNPIKVLSFFEEFEVLVKKGFLKKQKIEHHYGMDRQNDRFMIHDKIKEALLREQPMPTILTDKPITVWNIIEDLYKLGKDRDTESMDTCDLCMHAQTLMETNVHFPLIDKIYKMELNIHDKIIYFYVIWKTMSGHESVNLDSVLSWIYDSYTERLSDQQEFVSLEHALIKLDLVTIEEAYFLSDTELKLSAKSLEILKVEGISLYGKIKNKNIIEPKSIAQKELFYMDEELQQITMLKNLLEENKLQEIIQRLASKNLPKGITTLLYGAPGTGKTETVLQIAKETQRELIKVDISESKSMWFGQSEKIIKKIFTDYKEYSKQCERTPILLFNEADAIISKRKGVSNSSVDQTENTIQNIILEELENFEGIFLATTNLAQNFDPAFERRFLFKIEFHKPNAGIKSKIWKSKLQNLSNDDCNTLASLYDFSGAQIDNIVRKAEMHEIIQGEVAGFDTLVEFCKSELLTKSSRVKIGFMNN